MENQPKESNALNLGDRGTRIQELHNMLESLNFEVTEPLDCFTEKTKNSICLLYTSPSPRDQLTSRMPSSA